MSFCLKKLNLKASSPYLMATLTGYLLMGLSILTQIALVPLYLHHIGKSAFGTLMMILGAINYAAIGVGWVSGGGLRLMGEASSKSQQTELGTAFRLSKAIYLLYALALSFVAFVGWKWTGDYLGKDFVETTPRFHITLLPYVLTFFILSYDTACDKLLLTALNRQAISNFSQALTLLTFAILVIALLPSHASLETVFLCQILSLLPSKLITYLYRIKNDLIFPIWKWRLKDSVPELKKLVGSMGAGYLAYGALVITLQADVVLVGKFQGPIAAAEFVLVWKIADVIVQLIWRTADYMQPQFIHMDARNESHLIQSTYLDAKKKTQFVALAAGAAYALVGPYIVQIWVGSSTAPPSRIAFALAGGAIYWLAIARLPSIWAFATVKLKPLITVTTTEAAIKVALIALLSKKFGILAPLIGVNAAHLFWISRKYQQLSPLVQSR